MRLYFDNNVYNRPFDDLGVPRNRDEARVIEELFEKIHAREVVLVSSFVVGAENHLSPDDSRREKVRAFVELAREHVGRERAVLRRAETLNGAGLGSGDALHLAAAEHAGVDWFVTCDDKLLGRVRRIGSSVKVASLLELSEEGWIRCKPAT